MYERAQTDLAAVYSEDYGKTWSSSYTIDTDDPRLTQRANGYYCTEAGAIALVRKLYRPRMTDDGQGGLIYNFASHFYVARSSDPNYNNFDGFDYGGFYDEASNIFVGNITQVNFFELSDISDVRNIAVGDSDNDKRMELFISHDQRVTLLEIVSEENGITHHTQKWQSPYYDKDTGSVAIFDANGNNWPELIFTVKGGNVYAFEISDINQPINDEIYLTNPTSTLHPKAGLLELNSFDNLVVDMNGDLVSDLVVTSNIDSQGIYVWNRTNDTPIASISILGKVSKIYYLLNNGDPVLVVISDKRITVISGTNSSIVNEHSYDSPYYKNNHLFMDLNNDDQNELILTDGSNIVAINPITFDDIWNKTINPDNTGKSLGYFDLITTEFEGISYIGFSSSDLSTYRQFHIIDLNGSLVNSYENIEPTFDYNTKSTMSDFNNDGSLDIAIKTINTTTEYTDLIVYTLDTMNLILNHTIPDKGGILDRENLPIFSVDANFDGVDDILIPVSYAKTIGGIYPEGFVGGIFAIDVKSETIIWSRTFNNKLINVEEENVGDFQLIMLHVENEGTFAITASRADVFWSNGLDNPVISSIFSEQDHQYIVVSTINGTSVISEISGLINGAVNEITPQDYHVSSNTISLYDIKSVDPKLNSFVFPLDITGTGIQNLFIGLTNGTITLRNFDFGELWRLSLNAYSSIIATSLEYDSDEYGVAYITNPGNLVIQDRISPIVILNVSGEIYVGGTITHLIPISVGGDYQSLLVQSAIGSKSRLSIFDPVLKKFIWNSSIGNFYPKIKLGNYDVSQLDINTHIIGLDYTGIVTLITLPNSIISGGDLPVPTIGTNWVDFYSYTKESHLTAIYLLSDVGEVTHYVWNLDSSVTNYGSNQLTGIPDKLDVSIGTDTNYILVSIRESGGYLLKDFNDTITNVTEFDNFYSGYINNKIVNYDAEVDDEVILSLGNMIAILTINGEILETHSFSSDIVELISWYPDVTLQPAFVSILSNGNIEVSDPQDRKIGTKLSIINNNDHLEMDVDTLIVILPEAIWTEYSPDIISNSPTNTKNYMLYILLIFAIPIIYLIRRKLKT